MKVQTNVKAGQTTIGGSVTVSQTNTSEVNVTQSSTSSIG
jgi:hypothetical protein